MFDQKSSASHWNRTHSPSGGDVGPDSTSFVSVKSPEHLCFLPAPSRAHQLHHYKYTKANNDAKHERQQTTKRRIHNRKNMIENSLLNTIIWFEFFLLLFRLDKIDTLSKELGY
jgi:hypothetical protein